MTNNDPAADGPAGTPCLSAEEAAVLRHVEAQLQLAEIVGEVIGAATARVIAAGLRTSSDGALDEFAETGNLHPARALEELGDRTYDLFQVRWAAVLMTFIDGAHSLASTRPTSLTIDQSCRVYLAPASGIGGWVELTEPAEVVHQNVRDLMQISGLADVPWAVHAYVGFHFLLVEEYENLDALIEVAHGIAPAWRGFCGLRAIHRHRRRDPGAVWGFLPRALR